MYTKPILVTGATGYIGGRLVPKLLEQGYRVRAMGRSLAKLNARPWANHPLAELAEGNVLDERSLVQAIEGCYSAFYLVHSMLADPKGYTETDRLAAQNMARVSAAGGLEHIIYLGGLGSTEDPDLSVHLQSRHEVAQILQAGPVPITFLRAAMILGSGSASFEILRYLVDRLPVMITPRWVRNSVQPIAITNVLNYLQGCLEHEETKGQTFDIGGPEVVSYRQLFDIYAEEAGLPHRMIIPVPVLSPKLSSYWIHLVTPVPASIARPLAEGLRNPVICKEHRIKKIIPQELLDCRQTIRLALDKVKQQQVDTCWTDSGTAIPPEWTYCGDAKYAGGTILRCSYRVQIHATPEEVWKPVIQIGGETGYYFGNCLWKLRGWMDRIIGGIGFRGGRRNPRHIGVGDALDFWRVIKLEPPHSLKLLAEMKLPGEAVLEFHIVPQEDGKVELRQTAKFLPRGLGGIVYWYSLYPIHQWIFKGMLKGIAEAVAKPVIKGP